MKPKPNPTSEIAEVEREFDKEFKETLGTSFAFDTDEGYQFIKNYHLEALKAQDERSQADERERVAPALDKIFSPDDKEMGVDTNLTDYFVKRTKFFEELTKETNDK